MSTFCCSAIATMIAWVKQNGPAVMTFCAVAVCSILAYQKLEVMNDDVFITLAYAKNLAAGKGFVFNAGERVLGTTTPLLAMLLAGLHIATGVSIVLLAKLLVIACLAATTVLLERLLAREGFSYIGACLAPLVFFNWSIYSGTGNETALLFVTVSLALYLYRRGKLTAALLVGAFAYLARGEGILVNVVILGHHLWTTRRVPSLRALAPAAAVLVAWHGFAFVYFDAFLPNTLQVKTADWGQFHPTFFQALPDRIWETSQLWRLGVLFGVPLIGGLILLARREPLILMYVGAHLAGYSLLRATSHSWYYHSLGYLWALSLAVAAAWLIDGCFRGAFRRLRWLAAIGSALVLLSVSPFGHIGRQVDSRYRCYRLVANYLQAHLGASEAVVAQEIGILGYYLDRQVLDSDFLVHRQVPEVKRYGKLPYLLRQYRPRYLVTHACLGQRGVLQDQMRYDIEGEIVTYSLERFVTVPGYHAGIYRLSGEDGNR